MEQMLNWVEDPVYSIREKTISVMIQLSQSTFSQEWLEQIIKEKIDQLAKNENFNKRSLALLVINLSASAVSKDCVNTTMFSVLETLAQDPVPNIKFNVAKAIEKIKDQLTVGNRRKSQMMMETMANDQTDQDVQFFATKCLSVLTS